MDAGVLALIILGIIGVVIVIVGILSFIASAFPYDHH